MVEVIAISFLCIFWIKFLGEISEQKLGQSTWVKEYINWISAEEYDSPNECTVAQLAGTVEYTNWI